MTTALLRSETINNPLEDDDRCAGWRPRIIESAGEPDFLLGRSLPRHPDSSLGYDHPAFPEVALTIARMTALIVSGLGCFRTLQRSRKCSCEADRSER